MAKHADSVAMTALRIAGHVLRERIRPHMAKCAGDVPSSVAVLTPEWWTAVMCAAHPDARVLSFDVMGESAGTHQRHRFLLSYNEAGHIARLPMAVFTKTLPNVLTRMIGGYNGTARAEGRFYQEIRPALAIEAPQGYHTAFDRDTLAGINVLEDIVTSRGARLVQIAARLDLADGGERCRLVCRIERRDAASGKGAVEEPDLADGRRGEDADRACPPDQSHGL